MPSSMDSELTREVISDLLIELADRIPPEQGLASVLTTLFLVSEVLRAGGEMKLISAIFVLFPKLYEQMEDWLLEQHPERLN